MINIRNTKTYSIKQRFSKVNLSDFAKAPAPGRSFRAFCGSLPNLLRARDFRAVVEAIANARRKKKAVIFMCGAHVIKCGLSAILIKLIEKKILSCLAFNGACLIHDFEIAFAGRTSEDVAENLKTGKFGMGRETAAFINDAINKGVAQGLGLGESVAAAIARSRLPHKRMSVLSCAYKHRVPVCVHVAVGTDIIHQHVSFDGARTGEGSARDFYQLADAIRGLNNGGVVLNFGSAVILPEVFLKALNLSRNVGFKVANFTTANFDMVYHYRPSQNIVQRPVLSGGAGYYIIGHHEIMLPLLAQAVLDKI
jgi:hypothetical protein